MSAVSANLHPILRLLWLLSLSPLPSAHCWLVVNMGIWQLLQNNGKLLAYAVHPNPFNLWARKRWALRRCIVYTLCRVDRCQLPWQQPIDMISSPPRCPRCPALYLQYLCLFRAGFCGCWRWFVNDCYHPENHRGSAGLGLGVNTHQAHKSLEPSM